MMNQPGELLRHSNAVAYLSDPTAGHSEGAGEDDSSSRSDPL